MVYTYIRCSRCSKHSTFPLATIYDCEGCSNKKSVSPDRMTFNCEIMDDTGSLAVTVFTQECEALFRMPAAKIVRVRQTDDHVTFGKIQNLLKISITLVENSPSPALVKKTRSYSGCLRKWLLGSTSQHGTLNPSNKSARSPEETIIPSQLHHRNKLCSPRLMMRTMVR